MYVCVHTVSARFDSPKLIQPKQFHLKWQVLSFDEKECVVIRLVSPVLNRRAEHTQIIYTGIAPTENVPLFSAGKVTEMV